MGKKEADLRWTMAAFPKFSLVYESSGDLVKMQICTQVIQNGTWGFVKVQELTFEQQGCLEFFKLQETNPRKMYDLKMTPQENIHE